MDDMAVNDVLRTHHRRTAPAFIIVAGCAGRTTAGFVLLRDHRALVILTHDWHWSPNLLRLVIVACDVIAKF